jgi:hypothetical protein
LELCEEILELPTAILALRCIHYSATAYAAYRSCTLQPTLRTVAQSERRKLNQLAGIPPTEPSGPRSSDENPYNNQIKMSFRGGGRGGFRGDRGGGGRGGGRGGFQSYGPPATVLGMRLQKSRLEH